MKKWAGRLVKIAFFLFAFFAVIATLLYNMGGNSDTLKGAIEDYISQSTGYAAKIDTFNKMTFFPNIGVDIENVRLKSVNIDAMKAWAKAENEKPQAQQGRTPPPIGFNKPDATIEKLVISIGFFDAGFGRGRKIHKFNVQNASFNAGIIAEQPVNFDAIAIDEDASGNAFLNVEGDIAGEEFTAALDLESAGRGSGRKYKIGDESKFEAAFANITLNGVMRPRTMGGLHVRDLVIRRNEADIAKTTFTFIRDEEQTIELNGTFEMTEHGSNGEFDWIINAPDTDTDASTKPPSGNITAEKIHAGDFDENSNLSAIWKTWDDVTKADDQNTIEKRKTDIVVEAKTYQDGTQTIAPFNGKISLDNHAIMFESTKE